MASQPRSAVVPEGPLGARLPLVAVSIRDVAADVKLFEFEHADGAMLPSVQPGAHIDLFLANGAVRQYSLLNASAAPNRYRIAVKRQADGRGGSMALHDLRVGDRLQTAHPRNNFPLVETAGNTVLIAGGIGVTPLWSMAARLTELSRPWSMHYFCRSRAEVIAPEGIGCAEGQVRMAFSALEPRSPSAIADIVAVAPPSTHFYCCGPLPMLQAFEAATAALPPELVHVEYFNAGGEIDKAGGFTQVELARSGRVLEVEPGRTIAEVVAEAGIDVLTSCTEGYCGTCETRVLAGVPDHRDVVLTRAERASNTTMMICCSRSLSERLVLDL